MTKPTKWHVHPAKTHISLGICPVWSESLLSAWRKLGSLATRPGWPESSLGIHTTLFVLSWCGSYVFFQIPSPEEDSKDTDSTEELVSSEEVSSRPSPTHITLFTPSTPNIPTILATPASEHKLSDIEEASENLSKVNFLNTVMIISSWTDRSW